MGNRKGRVGNEAHRTDDQLHFIEPYVSRRFRDWVVAGNRRRVGIQRTSPARDLAGKSENPRSYLVVGGYLQHYSFSIFWFYSSTSSGRTLRISLLLVRQPLDPHIFSFC